MTDLSFTVDDYKLNIRVGALLEKGDKVLMHRSIRDEFYTPIGGRIAIGEDSVEALKREFLEELSITITDIEVRFVIENFFMIDGQKIHEISFIYKAKTEDNLPKGESFIVDHLEFKWFEKDKLSESKEVFKPDFLNKKTDWFEGPVEHLIEEYK